MHTHVAELLGGARHDTKCAGGIVVLSQKEFLRRFDVVQHDMVVPGRASALRGSKPGLFAVWTLR